MTALQKKLSPKKCLPYLLFPLIQIQKEKAKFTSSGQKEKYEK